jgi:hypothetical protein
MIVHLGNTINNIGAGTTVSLRCPSCRQRGTFSRLASCSDGCSEGAIFGFRHCPNSDCQALIFFVADQDGKKLLATYPAERLDFDASNLPAEIVAAVEEAITCHANECFIAAAIMVRKALELTCDAQGAQAANLQERIRALRSKVVLPQELFDVLDDLRFLGNDAAHVNASHFNQVEREEVELAIEVTKEILKSLYQLEALVSRLQARKKSKPI